ncbi:MAG: hypothetical protein LUC91_02245 [Prevotella sp.]|nr:hypothetical protein [Prevotella sp.]
MMRIVFRNFITLLSIGAFDTEDSAEAMSQFKWSQMLQLADNYDVTDFISLGISKMYNRNSSLIPPNILKLAKGHISDSQTIYFKNDEHYNFTQKSIKKFSNFFLNRKLNKIIFNEIHSIDTSVTSLVFLLKLIDTMNGFLTVDRNFRNVIDLGTYLRNSGDKIDFIKIDLWLKSLRMKGIANLIGSYLVVLFNFTPDELPFIDNVDEGVYAKVYNSVEKPVKQDDISSDDDKPIRIRGIISPVHKPNTNASKYFAYCPLEVTSKILKNISKSLSNVEE